MNPGIFDLADLQRSLVSGMRRFDYLFTVEFLPFVPVEFFMECTNEATIDKIDEGVANVALVLHV